MNQVEFKKWLSTNYPKLKSVTINSTASDAFYIFRHDIGITFEEIIEGKKTLYDYKEVVKGYLLSNGKNPGTRPSVYTSHLKYLIEYAKVLGISTIEFEKASKKISKRASKRNVRVRKEKTINVSESDVEESAKRVEEDPVYGKESKSTKKILNRFPKHKSLEEIISKICVIDVTHSTHIGTHKKSFSVVDLAVKIKNIPNIDLRLEKGDLSLVDEIANIKGVNLLSFASKYCACHNQMIYRNDDYYKFDSVVKDAIGYRKRIYTEYVSILDKIVTLNKLTYIKNIRQKLDYYFWYNNK